MTNPPPIDTPIRLEVSGLAVEYAGARALDGVAITVEAGEAVALMGANGAGKSTVIRAVSGVLGMYAGAMITGSIRFGDRDLGALTALGVVEAGIAQVPEGRKVFGDLSVRDNLAVAARNRRTAAEEMERIFDLFPALKNRIRTQAGWLSGGEQQMLAIGRALMTRPAILMIDELSLGLAPKTLYSIVTRLEILRAESGIGILLVEQNARLALKFSDRAYVIANGRVEHSGTSKDLLADDEVEQRYLGGAAPAAEARTS
jgi:branched-chain amino acid transport system ATP-binding protein